MEEADHGMRRQNDLLNKPVADKSQGAMWNRGRLTGDGQILGWSVLRDETGFRWDRRNRTGE